MNYETLKGLLGTTVYRVDDLTLFTYTLIGIREFSRRYVRVEEPESATTRLEIELLATNGIADWFDTDDVYFGVEDAKTQLTSLIESEIEKLLDKTKDWNVNVDTAKLGKANEQK